MSSETERTTAFTLRRVEFVPKELGAGVLYVSEEYGVAVHLCACGCGNKIVTPLGPAEWTFNDDDGGPTLHPSIGNWQLPCRSHYFITAGTVHWSVAWSPEQVELGRQAEERRRSAYYESRRREISPVVRLWNWFTQLFKRR